MSDTPGSPQWWLRRLERDLKVRSKRIERWNAYYDGRHELAFATERFKAAFGGQFRELADNWMALVVDSVEERLNVEGFRFGSDSAADSDAWWMWQANNLDAESGLGHLEALVTGTAYALVDWTGSAGDLNGTAVPLVTVEDPTQVIHANEPGNRRVRAAALKRWRDDVNGDELAVLYLPDTVIRLQRNRGRWDSVEEIGNPLGVVPVVPLENRTRLLGEGVAEHRNVIPLQDAVNKLVADMIVASEYSAFFQRWATGIDIPEDADGKPVAPFDVGLNKLLVDSNPDARFGAFPASDLSAYVRAIELAIQHIASQSRTPPHYLLGSMGTFPSGEALRSTETGLVAKVRRRMRSFEDAWEEVVRLCFRARGDARAGVVDAETVWRDPESRTESEHIDALSKLRALEVPVQQLWEDAGYSPQQIGRFRTLSAEDLLQQAIVATAPQQPVSTDVTPTVQAQAEALNPPTSPRQTPSAL